MSHRTLRQRLAVLAPGIVDKLLQVVRPHGIDCHETNHRQDMALEVGLVVDALACADLRLFVGVVPLPCPLLDRERPADDLHAAGVEVLVIAHLLLENRLVVFADVFADGLSVRLMPDRDCLDVFVGVFFLGLFGHFVSSLAKIGTSVRYKWVKKCRPQQNGVRLWSAGVLHLLRLSIFGSQHRAVKFGGWVNLLYKLFQFIERDIEKFFAKIHFILSFAI